MCVTGQATTDYDNEAASEETRDIAFEIACRSNNSVAVNGILQHQYDFH